MSIEVSTLVWEHSTHAANPLNTMLALADMANHDGYCWPSVDSLAKRCRCSERQMQRIIAELEESGELYIERGVGRKNVSRYLITLNTTVDQMSRRLVHYFNYTPAQAIEAATKHLKKGDIWRKKVTQVSPKPKDKKGDKSGEKVTDTTPFQAEEKGDIPGEKVTSEAEKVTSGAEKGDIAMSPDPSITLPDPSVNNASRATPGQPSPPAPKPAQPAAAAVNEASYQTVLKAYHNEIGVVTPIIEEEIKAQLRQCPVEWLTKAIGIAVKRNNRRWSYVEGILHRWQVEGFDGGQDNLSANAKGRSNGRSKSTGYGRQEQRGGTSPRKGKSQDAIDEDMAQFIANFVDARDGTTALAAD